jgi:hypothetical protein
VDALSEEGFWQADVTHITPAANKLNRSRLE